MLSRNFFYAISTKFSVQKSATERITGFVNQVRNGSKVTIDVIHPFVRKGVENIINSRLNKGLAFTYEERQILGIQGLLAPAFKTQEDQLEMLKYMVNFVDDNLVKYAYLSELQDRNKRLFYRFLTENIEETLPIVYTPTVGLACQKFGLIYHRPRGIFISIYDRGNILKVLRNWPISNIRAIVVTDGERVLGLGDLGANGMCISVGKLALYTSLGGIDPDQCLPIVLDVGTNNESLRNNPVYIGLNKKRATGKEYDDFIEEFLEAVVKCYGENTLIQFEDFGIHNAFRILDKYRDRYCVFNDDIQGTASVVVAGLYASKRITGNNLAKNKFLFVGAGGAALGIADLCVKAMQDESKISIEEARNKIWMTDINGLLTSDRNNDSLEFHQKFYVKDHKPMNNLEEMIRTIRPTVLIGATAATGIFTPAVLKLMAENNEYPVVFALSNPTSKAECTAVEAYENTNGKVVFSSGSPFPPVTTNKRTFIPGQCNNAFIFPGVALGVITAGVRHIPNDIFLIAAKECADFVSDSNLAGGSIYPRVKDIPELSLRIAVAIIKYAYCEGIASEPKPEHNINTEYLKKRAYKYTYEPSNPDTWSNGK